MTLFASRAHQNTQKSQLYVCMCLCMINKTEHFYFPALGYSPVSENKLFGFRVRYLLSRLVNALFRSYMGA